MGPAPLIKKEDKQKFNENRMDLKENRIVKLNNENYSIWKYKMELILIKEDLWDKVMKERVVEEEAPTAAAEADWKKSDNKTRALIGLSVEDDQLTHIRKEVTAWGSWEVLRKYHEKSSLSNKVHIMRVICSLKMGENGNAEEHINQLRELFQKLTDIGKDKLSESWSVAMLLSSLSRSYDTLITALEAREEKDLTFAFVQQKVLAEYERRCNNVAESTSSESALALTSKGKGIHCFFCKKRNHMRKD